MREPDHLPLLAWADSQKVQAHTFPADKRIGRIRSIARVMHQRKSETGRRSYLQKAIHKYAVQLRSACVEETEIDIQLIRFENAIWSEFSRLSFKDDCS